MQKPRRDERVVAMGRRDRDHDGRLTDRDKADTMDHRDTPDRGPPHADLVDDGAQSGRDLFVVRLVFERLDTRAPGRVVARRAAEHDDGTAVGAHDPHSDAGATGNGSPESPNQTSPEAGGCIRAMLRGAVTRRRPVTIVGLRAIRRRR